MTKNIEPPIVRSNIKRRRRRQMSSTAARAKLAKASTIKADEAKEKANLTWST